MIKRLLFFLSLLLFISCKNSISSDSIIYQNDFENNNLSSIQNGIINQYNGSKVLGNYNNQNFILSLKNLPAHDLITITFDLYIHDQWDGNQSPFAGPDIWQMLVDGNPYINTTFSNATCGVNTFCPPQSYPDNYPNSNHNPKSGAYQTNLPGFCSMKGVANWTSLYKISKTITHSSNSITVECLDKLVQTDTVNPKCDESWSVDNIVIKTIKL
ncbi:MAG: hypothetical protein ACRYFB_05120 [Janthinobacterium lividum]